MPRFTFLSSLCLCFLTAVALAGPPSSIEAPKEGGPISPLDQKTPVQVDYPISQRIKNVGGTDGAGLCVFSSITMSARWQNVPVLENFQQWMRKKPGGGYPEKVDKMIAEYCREQNVEVPEYIQYEGDSLDVLRLALKTGRMPGVTYDGHDPHYRGSIAHMVNLIHLDDQYAAILDNNFIGESELVWMTVDEFKQRWIGGWHGWAVVLLNPPPPPVPINAAAKKPRLPNFKIIEGLRSSIVETGKVWVLKEEEEDVLYLYDNGKLLGAYSYDEKLYHEWKADTYEWLQGQVIPPFPLPEERPVPPKNGGYNQIVVKIENRNYGVDRSKMKALEPGKERWIYKGREIAEKEGRTYLAGSPRRPATPETSLKEDFEVLGKALEAAWQAEHFKVGEPYPLPSDKNLIDDSQFMRLTVVGSPESTQRVLNDFHTDPRFSHWQTHLVVQAYPPNHWAVVDVNFPRAWEPTVVIQAAPNDQGQGKVLVILKGYQGADQLLAALRKADPNFDPLVPNPPNPGPGPNNPLPVNSEEFLAFLKNLPMSAWLLIGGGLLAYLLGKRKN